MNSFKIEETEADALTSPQGDKVAIRKSGTSKKGTSTVTKVLLGIIIVLLLLLLICIGLTTHFAKKTYSLTNNATAVVTCDIDCIKNEPDATELVSSKPDCIKIEKDKSDTYLTGLKNLTSFLSPISKNRVKDVRLPYTVIPEFYIINLQANLYDKEVKDFTINGSCQIRIVCNQATDTFFIHAHSDLRVNTSLIRVHDSNDENNLLSNITYDMSRQWFQLKLSQSLLVNKTYLVEVGEFQNNLTINLKGWYLSEYREKNVVKYMATSQLQPTDARRVFPCWDEPAFKAQFQINIRRMEHFHSMSNMPMVKSLDEGNGWFFDVYAPTLNTSTYLLAFVVSQLEALPGLDSQGRNFTIWARPDLIGAAQYALDVGKKIIRFFEEYFELDYPLNKTDMLAVPHFAAGAMENWGLMIYREATLIWDPISGTEVARQKVATVISHEIAHQWFGNLVTLNWWDDLWLNEGFATFVEYLGVAHAEPEWQMDEQFAVLQLQKVFFIDSLATTHPVFMPVYHPDEINEIFDTISYNKGASILRMMEAFLGREVFRIGLKIYLSRHKFKNTEPVDLWDALKEANNESNQNIDIHSIMNCWIKQTGYPLVTVKKIGESRYEVTQQRFVLGFELENNSISYIDNSTWHIPLTYALASEDQQNSESRITWMSSAKIEMDIIVPKGEWFAFNLRQTGFYRVNYDKDNWDIFINTLLTNHTHIPRLTRAQLIDDSFNIANQGAIDFEVFFKISQYLKNERDMVPLNAAYRVIKYIYDMLMLHESNDEMKRYVQRLINEAYQKIDWNSSKTKENHLLNLARKIVVTMACEAEHEDCIGKSKYLFNELMKNPSSDVIPTSLSQIIYCTAIRWGGAKEWNFLYEMRTTILHEDAKYNILDALGCSRDFGRLMILVRELIDDAKSKYDELELPSTLSSNPVGLYLIWDTIKREWGNRTASNNFKMIIRAVDKRSIIIQTLPIQDELQAMYEKVVNETDRATARSIARILVQSNRDKYWSSKYREKIHTWLKNNQN